jgi:hypothetical protein
VGSTARALLLAGLILIGSCSSDEPVADAPGACSVAEGQRMVDVHRPSPPEDLLQWAGLKPTADVELVAADEECGMDASARLALRGPSSSIDAALDAARFDVPTTSGLSIIQPALEGVDLASLAHVRSSDQERFTNNAGESLVRMYARGGTESGQDILHVWAFTT